MKKIILSFFVACSLIFVSSCKENKAPDSKMDHSQHTAPGILFGYADSVNAGLISVDTMKGSPIRTAMANIGESHIHIEYGSPGVKGRIIWGGLVPYGQVWATGAHHATSIQFSKEVAIGNKIIPAGKYAFFTVPGPENWIIIINKNFEQHLADNYKQEEDLVRLTIKPEITGSSTQRLSFLVNETGNGKGVIIFKWEKIGITVPVNTK